MTATFELIKSETIPLTDELLREFSDLPGGPTERTFKEDRVAHLKEKVLSGAAIPFIWAIGELNGERFRLNGQHSSAMLRNLDGQRPPGLMVHLDHYKVEDRPGLVRLFRQFDDRKSQRDPSDVAGAYQHLEEDLEKVDRKIAKLAIEGIAWFEWNVTSNKTLVGDDRYSLFNQSGTHPFLIWCGDIFDVKTKELEHPAILAAMWATWQKTQDHAREFWKLVAHGGVLGNDTHQATMLDEWLKTAKTLKNKPKPKPGEYYNACVYMWNAWRADKPLGKVVFDTSKGMLEVRE